MNNVNDLLKILTKQQQISQQDQKFFVKFDPITMRILKVFSGERPEESNVLPIDTDTGIKLVSGSENRSKWIVGFKDDVPELQKLSDITSFHRNRSDFSSIVKLDFKTLEDFYEAHEAAAKRKELLRKQQASKNARLDALIKKTQSPSFMPKDYWRDISQAQHVKEAAEHGNTDIMFDVVLTVNRQTDTVTIQYHGDVVKQSGKLLRFFFTREDDPSHLKCVINLDADSLDKITRANGLILWPNPLRIKIPYGTDDLSIFTVKSNLEILVMEEK